MKLEVIEKPVTGLLYTIHMTLKELNRIENKPYTSIKDPISALTHFIGFVSAIILTPVMLSKAAVDNANLSTLIGLSIYCLSMVLLYGASSAYHAFVLPPKQATILKKIDHMSVFILIAGSYTPILLQLDVMNIKVIMLIMIWLCAISGIIMKAFFVYCPKYVSSIIYIAMGWLAIFQITTFYQLLGPIGFGLLLAGGILYTMGGVLYAFKIKINEDWSEHEIFHIFVLLGSLCHFLMIYLYIA